jgi:hypothetical protein
MPAAEAMTKAKLQSTLLDERCAWRELTRQFNQAQMVLLHLPDGRTPKDVVAHVTWYERQLIGVLRSHALVGSELWDVSVEERNAAIYEQNKDRPLSDVLAESERVFAELIGLVGTLREGDLQDPTRFPKMPVDWEPWKLIAENSYEHYRGHRPELEGLLKGA